MAAGKRCHYEVLGLSRDCSADEIRSAYKKLALQRHPDKLIQSGLSQTEATAQFQELSHAYEVLSDPKERAWYDSHRSQILFSDPDSGNSVPDSVIPNLFSFFSNTVYSGYADSGKGFYKVYSDVFYKIYSNEVNFCRKLGLGLEDLREAPVMGNLQSPYEQVTAFYNYWLGFSTVMDFCWADQYDVMAGPNRKSRRVMEEENKKLRKKAKREYNETVRGLAEFVKKRDKRVIDMMVKKNAEMEKRKEEERERKQKLQKERMERAKTYKEPEWARVNEEEVEELEAIEEENGEKKEEFYCVVCGKKFKSEKQWKNHEQSKKHKEKLVQLRKSFVEEEVLNEEDLEEEELKNGDIDRGLDEMEGRFKEGFRIGGEGNGIGVDNLSDDEDIFLDAEDVNEVERFAEDGKLDRDDGGDDGQGTLLEDMVSGHKNRKNQHSRIDSEELSMQVNEDENELLEAMEYDNRKGRRRKAKKEKGKNCAVEAVKGNMDEDKNREEDTKEHTDEQIEELSSHSLVENGCANEIDIHLGKNRKISSDSTDRKRVSKKETNTRSKKSSKAKKGKTGNLCDTCGEEFESRNKLHRHLGETGHATLKYR
ncbi:hypothetical protein K2173_025621 [Erythroxylum novogranatense]|uniref:Uncharacterized protein n=1 Tax=Erythroxylum novogranatense TaxID=1862640 RepID=A0AAV8SP05_9ROSI|nr:hypothetical protein K2173_025621 [Erythroxylum novogranatense]